MAPTERRPRWLRRSDKEDHVDGRPSPGVSRAPEPRGRLTPVLHSHSVATAPSRERPRLMALRWAVASAKVSREAGRRRRLFGAFSFPAFRCATCGPVVVLEPCRAISDAGQSARPIVARSAVSREVAHARTSKRRLYSPPERSRSGSRAARASTGSPIVSSPKVTRIRATSRVGGI